MTIDKPPDDARLVEIIQTGSRAEAEAAIEQLYVRHASHLFGYLLSTGFAKEEQREIANEVWHRAWRRMAQLRFSSKIGFFPWLRGIAKNVVRERFRAKYLRERVTADSTDTDIEAVSDHEAFGKDPAAAKPFEHAMIRSLNHAEFRKLVEELLPDAPADYRELINAKFFCGFSVEEIAQLNAWKPSKVHLTTYRAVCWLREKLVERHGPDVADRWFVP
jgi:RNA polymerase sigma factor (sigma-70 family)